tara:strand:+ start:1093 stop:1218 length:126 start_codon:yes stop_codon:yes gene_type:complete
MTKDKPENDKEDKFGGKAPDTETMKKINDAIKSGKLKKKEK